MSVKVIFMLYHLCAHLFFINYTLQTKQTHGVQTVLPVGTPRTEVGKEPKESVACLCCCYDQSQVPGTKPRAEDHLGYQEAQLLDEGMNFQ